MNDLLVTIDFDMVHIPCEVVDLRFTSKRGAHHTLKRYHLQNAKEDPSKHVEYIFQGNRLLKDVLKAWKEGEGCKIKGGFHLHFLSNNFYVGVGNNQLLGKLLEKTKKSKISLEHRVNELSFGPNSSNNALSKKFNLKGFNTLGNHYSSEDRKDGYGGPFYHSYYITAVPNVFDRMFGRLLETFQYTASAYVKRSMRAAVVFV